MKQFTAKLLALGPAGLVLLSMLDSAGVPLYPGTDLLLIVLAAQRPAAAYGYALLTAGGSLVGSLVLFFLARRGGQLYLDRRTASGRGAKLRHWFQHYGLLSVFVPALVPLVPLPLKVFVLCAGALSVNPWTFAGVIVAARVPRYLALAYLGSHFGEDSWGYLRQHVWGLLGFALLTFLLLFGAIKLVDFYRGRHLVGQ